MQTTYRIRNHKLNKQINNKDQDISSPQKKVVAVVIVINNVKEFFGLFV